MKTFENVWNDSNEYRVPKSTFNVVWCLLFSLYNSFFESLQKNFNDIFMGFLKYIFA